MSERTLEKWTPRLLLENQAFRSVPASQVCVSVCVCVYLCIPEHSIHSVMPRLMEAQSGPGSPQSQHCWFPGMAWTSCRALRPWLS